MKVAYLILCHDEPYLVKRIINRLKTHHSNYIFVHVDLKSDISKFYVQPDGANIVFLNKRYNISWGGWNSVLATIELLKIARSYDLDRYVLLQGKDYPLHTNEQIIDFFTFHSKDEFINCKEITHSKFKKDYSKCHAYFISDNKTCMGKFLRKVLNRLNYLGIKYRKGFYYDLSGLKCNIYTGWAQFALTSSCVDWILFKFDNEISSRKYISHCFPPDELYFHTIVANSKFRKNIPICLENSTIRSINEILNLTYFEYPTSVRIFKSLEEVKQIDRSRFLFFRKASSSEVFLDSVDEWLQESESNSK